MWRASFFAGILLGAAIGSIGCGGHVEPAALAEKRLAALLATDRMIRFEDIPWTVHVKAVVQLSLAEVVLKQKNAAGEIDLVVWAREGEWGVDAERSTLVLQLHAGKTLAADGTRGSFFDRTFNLPLPVHLFQ
jgi:hypothetical protein